MVEWNLDSLRRLGISPEEDDKPPVMVPRHDAVMAVERLLGLHGLQEKGFIHLHPASRWSFKCWPVRQNAALIDALHGRGETVVLTAAPDAEEKDFIARIVSQCARPPINLAGELSLQGLAALSSRAKLFVGVDSAPMHIASAMRTPVVALFGPSGEAEWGPWGAMTRVVVSERHVCRPCGVDGCGGGKISDCLSTLPENAVLRAIDELLDR